MKDILNKIYTRTYCDYSDNTITNDELQQFSDSVMKIYGVKLDETYLKFISKINGFELNGLSFYGTKEISDLYVSSTFMQNDFWKAEMAGLSKYYLLGNSGLRFYCFDSNSREFIIFPKDLLSELNRLSSFTDLLEVLVNNYI